MKVVVSEFIDPSALKEFGAGIQVTYDPELVDDRSGLLAAIRDASGVIIRNKTRVDDEFLAAAANLKVVGRLGVGLDNIDLDACARRAVAVRPATGANSLSVVEYVLSAAMILTRGAYGCSAAMVAGNWPRGAMIGGEISGRVLGLYGFGGIARMLASRARALGMKVVAHDPFLPVDEPAWQGVTRLSAAEVLTRADVLSLHVPLTDKTRNMIGPDEIAGMKSGAILINTARGGIVDECALAAALKSGHLGGAALDVFSCEPLDASAGAVFDELPNLILTPHIAGVTAESNARVSALTVANVLKELADA